SKSWVHQPVPYSGPITADYVVVGEAPTQGDNRSGEPFSSHAGRLFRRLLGEADLLPTDDSPTFPVPMFTYTVACWPGDRVGATELAACRGHLDNQLELAGTPYVLLVGSTALSAFRPDLSLMRANGWAFVRDGIGYVPVLSPGFLQRQP